MKFILTIIISVFSLAAFAGTGDDIRVRPGKDAALVLSFQSVSKKNIKAVVTIRDAAGKIISEKNTEAVFGENLVPIGDTVAMNEGDYRVQVRLGDRTLTTNYTVWK